VWDIVPRSHSGIQWVGQPDEPTVTANCDRGILNCQQASIKDDFDVDTGVSQQDALLRIHVELTFAYVI
jgi:hypothetical protein